LLRSDRLPVPTFKSDRKNGKGDLRWLLDASSHKLPSGIEEFHETVQQFTTALDTTTPTLFHQMIAELAGIGKILRLYTMNIDGLDARQEPLQTKVPLPLEGPWPTTIQLHGSINYMTCMRCNDTSALERSLFVGKERPPCTGKCQQRLSNRTGKQRAAALKVGELSPRISLYNAETFDAEAIERVLNADLQANPDAILVVGTSLPSQVKVAVKGISDLCRTVNHNGDGLSVWINPEHPSAGHQSSFNYIVNVEADVVAEAWNDAQRNETAETDPPSEEEEEEETYMLMDVLVMLSERYSGWPEHLR
jgi:NAD-dependent histone deacetylase SIR2